MEKTDWLNSMNFQSLLYHGPGTSLEVGLADGHEWMGGASEAQNGVICNPNITSEEVFSYFLKLKQKNKTILIATHNRDIAKRADYTLRLSNGNIKRFNV